MKRINLHSRVARQVIQQEYGNYPHTETLATIGYTVISKGMLYARVTLDGWGKEGIRYVISVVERCKDGTTTRRTELLKSYTNMAQVYSEIYALQEIYS